MFPIVFQSGTTINHMNKKVFLYKIVLIIRKKQDDKTTTLIFDNENLNDNSLSYCETFK